MDFKDYYQVLGVSKQATAEEIKRAFRKLARTYHPDVNPGDASAEARFKEVNEAHEVLGDPEKRRKYDTLGANWRQYEQAPGGWPGGFPGGPNARWNVNTGSSPGGGRPLSEEELHGAFGGGFSDFFQAFFRDGQAGGAWPPPPRATRGRDTEYEIEFGLEDAFRGVTRRITLPATPGRPSRGLDVRIPAGVKTGSRVRVNGEGMPGAAGQEPGDLFLRVQLRPHPVFTVKGQNLYVTVAVPVPTAALGGEVEVQTLDGPELRLKIPAGTQPGQIFRLRGKGMPGLRRRHKRGDLYATAQITIPRDLTPAARRHYEALAGLETGASSSYTKVEP